MNINYHYYTIKTLALVAGFTEPEAQRIAHFSQYVDDCVLPRIISTNTKPSQWFFDQKLAKEIKTGCWHVHLCSTGISFAQSISSSFQCHSIVPFHFIPSKSLPDLINAPRTAYRCVTATPQNLEGKNILIDTLVKDYIHKATKAEKSSSKDILYMELGILLHTYADTYAHCYFSGLDGHENKSKIKKAFNKVTKKKAFHKLQIAAASLLPHIGHANVAVAPDVCYYQVAYTLDSGHSEKLSVNRDNTDFFALCSKNILAILCKITGKTPLTDDEFTALQKNIAQAQAVKNEEAKYLTPSWEKNFATLKTKYSYSKQQYFSLSYPFHRHRSHDATPKPEVNALIDVADDVDFLSIDPYANATFPDAVDPMEAYAEQYTDISLTDMQEKKNPISNNLAMETPTAIQMKNINEEFYAFMQLAYERIYLVCGNNNQFQESFAIYLAHSEKMYAQTK